MDGHPLSPSGVLCDRLVVAVENDAPWTTDGIPTAGVRLLNDAEPRNLNETPYTGRYVATLASAPPLSVPETHAAAVRR